MGLSQILYDSAASVAAIGATAIGMRRRARGRRGEWVRERFGQVSYGRRDFWIHAVSVGETVASVPLLAELAARYPGARFLFSTVTETGREVAQQRLGSEDVRIATVPWDIGSVVNRVLGDTRPGAVVTMETEIWPAFIGTAQKRGIPFLIVNGRISDRSYTGYRRARPFMAPVFRRVTGFGMQTEEDARRVMELGARGEAVTVLGNLKYDVSPPASAPPGWMRSLPGPVWVAGSTHRGEDAIILEAFREARTRIPRLTIVLAPRHPERFDEVAALVERSGLRFVRRSVLSEEESSLGKIQVVLLDAMGELARVYGGADVCFVGGSLVPTGGHNILEAVVWECPVIVGPHTDNFSEMVALFGNAGGVARVDSGRMLPGVAVDLLLDRERAGRQTAAAKQVLSAHQGAARRTAEWIETHVAIRPASR